jgi:hypothetical protein
MEFTELLELCRERNVAVQTIKSLARRPWDDRIKTYNTYFYEPFEAQETIDLSVQWAFGLSSSFLITAGDLKLVPKVLDAAKRYEIRPADTVMRTMVEEYQVLPIFR